MKVMLHAMLLALTGPSPAPVIFTNFPLGDPIVERTFWVALATLVAVGFQIFLAWRELRVVREDLEYTRKQMAEFTKRPDLSVTLWERHEELTFAPPMYSPGDGLDQPVELRPEFQINNDGQKAASGCYVSLWLPVEFTFNLNPNERIAWKQFAMRESFDSAPNQVYWRIETFLNEPIFFDHPVALPAFTVAFPKGECDLHMRWQAFSDIGKTPSDEPGRINFGVRFSPEQRAAIEEGQKPRGTR